jgi:hypothetical protein
MVALEFYQTYFKDVHRVVLIDGHIHTRSFLDQLTHDLQSQGQQQADLIGTHFQHWLNRDRTRKRNKLIQRAHFLIHQTSLINDLKIHTRPLDLQALKTLKIQDQNKGKSSVLGLYGQESDALLIAHPILTSLGDLLCFPNATHAVLWEKTDDVLNALVDWLNS